MKMGKIMKKCLDELTKEYRLTVRDLAIRIYGGAAIDEQTGVSLDGDSNVRLVDKYRISINRALNKLEKDRFVYKDGTAWHSAQDIEKRITFLDLNKELLFKYNQLEELKTKTKILEKELKRVEEIYTKMEGKKPTASLIKDYIAEHYKIKYAHLFESDE